MGTWEKVLREIHPVIEKKGYNAKRGFFIQAFDYPVMDAALLLLPSVEFTDYADERMVRTTEAVMSDLEEHGLLRRFPAGNDGLEGSEGVFLTRSFWLVECLVRQGRLKEAHKVFERALSTGDDLGLFSEECDVQSKEMLGDFPQGLTHFSLIGAAVALGDRNVPRSS
jgi:pentatricopeptide repeat protein